MAKYKNWVKAILSLKLTKDGLECFVQDQAKYLKKKILLDIDKESGKTAYCTECTTANILPCPTSGFCNITVGTNGTHVCGYHDEHCLEKTYRKCPNDICNRMYEKIKARVPIGNPSWINTDATKWCSDHWQIASCFMPMSIRKGVKSATDMDVIDILSFATSCIYLEEDIQIKEPYHILEEIAKTRHDMSTTLELTDTAFISLIDGIVKLLQGLNSSCATVAKPIISKVTELKNFEYAISIQNDIDANNAILVYIENWKLKQKDEIASTLDSKLKNTLPKETVRHLKYLEDTETPKHIVETTQEVFQSKYTEVLKKMLQAIDGLKNEIGQRFEDSQEESIKKRLAYLQKKQELQTILIQIYKDNLSSIPEARLLEEIDASADDVFEELVIANEMTSGPDISENRSPDQTISCYKEILYPNNTKGNHIYVIGNAGMGKTTWCMKMLRTWVSSCTKLTEGTIHRTDFSADEKTMSEFDVVFFVSLRYATSDNEIRDFIGKQLLLEYPQMIVNYKEVLEIEPHKCLIILDGLDEWSPPNEQDLSPLQNPGLPGIAGVNGCTLLTTMRSWKWELIRIKFKENHRAVQIQGVDDKERFAKRLIQKLRETTPGKSTATFNEFQKQVKASFYYDESDVLPSIMDVPFVLTYFVAVWFRTGCLEKTMAANLSMLLECMLTLTENKGRKRLACPVCVRMRDELVLPHCLQRLKNCKKNRHLIAKLSSLAGSAFFEKSQESSLVLSESSLQNKLDEEELQFALNIGVLSQSKVKSIPLSCRLSLSFLHKTLQYFFAAIHLVCSGNAENMETINQFRKQCRSHGDVKKIEIILILVCGMSTRVKNEMLDHIALVAKKYREDDTCYAHLSQELPQRCSKQTVGMLLGYSKDISILEKVMSSKTNKDQLMMTSLTIKEHASNLKHYLDRFTEDIENICYQIRSMHSDIVSVSAALDKNDQPEFVVICSNPEKTAAETKKKNTAFRDYSITFRNVSSEAKEVMYGEEYINTPITDNENEKIQHAINNCSKEIMDKWTNVCAISACPVRSIGYNTGNHQVLKEACIVIYVDVKFPDQRVPLGQKSLPKTLEGVPVDVRESYVTHFKRQMAKEFHQNVRMGCEIGKRSVPFAGTLGPFIDLPDNKTGCITSLHTMFEWQTMRAFLNKSVTGMRRSVEQPAGSSECFGHVKDVHFFEGTPGSNSGMEVAVIEIDPQRIPVDGEYPLCNMDDYGYDEDNPICYKSGLIYDTTQMNCDKTLLNKYGAATCLTEGKFFRKGSIMRPAKAQVCTRVNQSSYTLYDQIEIKDCGTPFAREGDSGALVLAPYHGNQYDLRAVGLLGGTLAAGTYYVTPITEILAKCNLQQLKSFTPVIGSISTSDVAEDMEI